MEQKENFQVQDIDEYETNEDQVFNHQALVMKAMKRCLELGALELHEGENIKEIVNNKIVIIHKPNERKQFINSIQILKSTMVCDFDKDATTNIKKLKEDFDELEDNLLEEQFKFYQNLTEVAKINLNLYVVHRNIFTPKLPFLQRVKDKEIDRYRNLFEELVLLTQRLDFYTTADASA